VECLLGGGEWEWMIEAVRAKIVWKMSWSCITLFRIMFSVQRWGEVRCVLLGKRRSYPTVRYQDPLFTRSFCASGDKNELIVSLYGTITYTRA